MEVKHVVGKNMETESTDNGAYLFLDGDVYVVDNGNEVWIWIGKDCAVEEQTVGAWIANKLDNQERGGEPSVYTVSQGNEPDEFLNLLEFEVIDGDTPGFLKHAELDTVEFKLYRVFIEEDTSSIDQAEVEEVKLKKSSLGSEDVYVLDGNEEIYMWVGKNAQREERFEGQKMMQAIDSERNFLPITYTIYEGEGGKSEEGFYELINQLAQKGSAVSVEDERELKYKPEDNTDKKEDHSMKNDEKQDKGFFGKLFSIFK